jgi:lysophospholipase L1-like esterase
MNVTTWGIYGAHIETITERAADIVPMNPKTIIVCIGTNNVQRGYSALEISASYDAMLSRLRYCLPATKIVVHAILPCNDERVPWGYFMGVNNAIRNIAAQHGLFFLDATANFLDAQGNVRPELYDGTVHLTLDGYKVWADFLMRNLSVSMFHGEV